MAVDSTASFVSGSAACSSFKGHGASAANVSSSSAGVSENENDDYDCGGAFHVSYPWVERHVHDQFGVVSSQ